MLLLSGFDTIHLGYQLNDLFIDKGEWSYLEKNKLLCQSDKTLKTVPVHFKGKDINLSRNGHYNWRYILSNDDIRLYLARNVDADSSFPEIYVHLNAQYLWRDNWLSQSLYFEDWIKEWTKIKETKISRVDPCQDFIEPLPLLTDNSQVVTYAKKKREYAERFNSFSNGKKVTGYEIGGKNLLCRIYNKSDEIVKTNHTWFNDLWSQSLGRPLMGKESVTRVEFQLRREIIKQMQISSLNNLHEQSGDLWRYLSHKWFRLAKPSKDKHRNRRQNLVLWDSVQEGVQNYEPLTGITRSKQSDPKIEQLKAMARGCLSSIVSISPETEDNQLKTWLWDMIFDHDTDSYKQFNAIVKDKTNRFFS